jgi:hypothetical protein
VFEENKKMKAAMFTSWGMVQSMSAYSPAVSAPSTELWLSFSTALALFACASGEKRHVLFDLISLRCNASKRDGEKCRACIRTLRRRWSFLRSKASETSAKRRGERCKVMDGGGRRGEERKGEEVGDAPVVSGRHGWSVCVWLKRGERRRRRREERDRQRIRDPKPSIEKLCKVVFAMRLPLQTRARGLPICIRWRGCKETNKEGKGGKAEDRIGEG